jgi:hypothetical protein
MLYEITLHLAPRISTGHTQNNGAVSKYSLLKPHHSFVYALYFAFTDDSYWAGHVMRMDESYPVSKVLCTEPGEIGDRKRGRPKVRWCDELEEDVVRVGCRNWRINTQSRE